MSFLNSSNKIALFVCGVLLCVAGVAYGARTLYDQVSLSLMPVSVNSTNVISDWVSIAAVDGGKIEFQVDIASFKMIYNEDNMDQSLMAIRSRFVQKDRTKPVPIEFEGIIVGVTNFTACLAGEGDILLGPETAPSESKKIPWSTKDKKISDFLAVYMCVTTANVLESMAKERSSKNKRM